MMGLLGICGAYAIFWVGYAALPEWINHRLMPWADSDNQPGGEN